MASNNEKSFKPKAHILRLLGEELIKNPVMAIYELIKNSYDADATECTVFFENMEDKKTGKISIEDNGTGINENVLENVWLEPGTDYRKPFDAKGNRKIKRSPILDRVPMGEKGVGRFASHKLGDIIKLTTRPAEIIIDEETAKVKEVKLLNYELELTVNWAKFSQKNYLQDIKVGWEKKLNQEKFYFKDSHGTFIQISGLKEPWTKGMARNLKRSTISMLSPKAIDGQFKIDLDFGNNWLEGIPSINEILEQAPFKLTALLDEDYNLNFEYEFETKNNSEIGKRNLVIPETNPGDSDIKENVRGKIRPSYRALLEEKEIEDEKIEKLLEDYDSSTSPFGSIMIEFYSYDLDAPSLRDITTTPKLVRRTLKEHAGVKVFKDDLRVFDYGEPGNDWLGLDLKRVNRKDWFSNNQNIGYVFLNAEDSSALVEKTNREGFIHNFAYEKFVLVIEYILTEFKAERYKDREKWRLFNKKGTTGSFEENISKFKEIVETTDLDNDTKKRKLLKEAEKLEKAFEERKNTLLVPAGVGMTASIAIHEIEKLVPRMIETVKSKPISDETISVQVEELQEYVNGVLSVLKKGGNKPLNILDSINQAFKNYSVKLKLRKIAYQVDCPEDFELKCDRRYFITMIMNLIDNSIYWLDTVYKDSKGIYVKVAKTENATSIILADNGPGFRDAIEDIVRPFYSRKEGGIGLGMYIVDTVMINYGKLKIYLPGNDNLDVDIPGTYDGAVVELVFKEKSETHDS